jgi:anti-sigma B factor antagonist
MLDIQIQQRPEGRVHVALNGRLDTNTYAACEERIKPLLTPETRVMVFDLSRLDYISSMGLRMLMMVSRALKSQGSTLLLTNVQPPVQTVIDIGNALPRESVFASVEEADRYLDLMQRRTRETGSASATV